MLLNFKSLIHNPDKLVSLNFINKTIQINSIIHIIRFTILASVFLKFVATYIVKY